MSDVGSIASAPQAVAAATHGKVRGAQKAGGEAAAKQVESTEKVAPEANKDPARGQSIDLSA